MTNRTDRHRIRHGARRGAASRAARALLPVALALWSPAAQARLTGCDSAVAPVPLRQAVRALRRVADPCGEGREISALLRKLARCPAAYRVCIDRQASQNIFDRPLGQGSAQRPRTITWNPELRSEIETSCPGDPGRPVRRDPVASLLHELVHAAQDCDGIDPLAHEFEAVRVENIYRRAVGLCQRSGYGRDPLPAAMALACDARHCSCAHPAPRLPHTADGERHRPPASAAAPSVSADSSARLRAPR